MRNALFVVLLALGLLVGCQSNPTNSNGTDLSQHEADIEAVVSLTTAGALLALSESDRAEVGSYSYQAAEAIYVAVEKEQLNLSGVKILAAAWIQKANTKQQALALFILQTSTTVIERQLATRYSNLADDQKVQTARVLVRAAARGVMDATLFYRPPGTMLP